MKRKLLRLMAGVLCAGILVFSVSGCSIKKEPETKTLDKDSEIYQLIHDEYIKPYLASRLSAITWSDHQNLDPDDLVDYYERQEVFQIVKELNLEEFLVGERLDNYTLVPEQTVEDYLTSRFGVSSDLLRQAVAYDPDSRSYLLNSTGGFGSTSYMGKIEQAGNLYTVAIPSEIEDGDTHTVVLQKLDTPEPSFRFLSGYSENEPFPVKRWDKDSEYFKMLQDNYLPPYFRSGIGWHSWGSTQPLEPDEIVSYYAVGEFMKTYRSYDLSQCEKTPAGNYRVPVPAQKVEDYLTACFEVSPEDLRTSSYYRSDENCYIFDTSGTSSYRTYGQDMVRLMQVSESTFLIRYISADDNPPLPHSIWVEKTENTEHPFRFISG